MNTTASTIDVPSGMKIVSEKEFFVLLKADPRDIMPSVDNPNFTDWNTKDHRRVGRSLPGWKNPSDDKVWMWQSNYQGN